MRPSASGVPDMASVRSTIELLITGSTRGLGAAAAEARAMADRVAAAEDRVSAARVRSAAAEERVRVVEERLSAARAQQEAALSRVGVAETNLARAREASLGSTTRLSQAQADLDAVRSRSGATTDEIAAAEERVTRVRQEADTAAARLQASEARLASARANADQSSARVAAAEAAINRARSDAIRASEDLARRENELNRIRRTGNNDIDRQRSGLLGVFDAVGRLADAFTGADGASTSFLSKMAALNSVVSSIGGPIVQAVVGVLELVAVMSALGEIVGIVGGLIGQVLGGVVPVLLTLGAAAGTVMLGLDGIQKAAEAAAPAFERLKAAVSGVFVQQLTPAFKELAGVLPQLTNGFKGIALAISGLIKNVIDFIASAQGIQALNAILSGTEGFVRGLSAGVKELVQGFILAGSAAAPAMGQLGDAIGSVLGRIGEVLTRLSLDGVLQKAVQGLAATIKGLGDVVAPVIEIFIRMGAAIGSTVGQSLSELGKIIETTTPFWENLARVAGELLLSAFQQLGPPIERLLQSLLPGATNGMDAFARIIETQVFPAIGHFIDWLRTDGIPGIVAFFLAATVNALTFASTFTGVIASILGVLSGFFGAMAQALAPFDAAAEQAFQQAAAATGAFKDQLVGLKAGIDGLKDKAVKVQMQVAGGDAVRGLQLQVDGIHDKFVNIFAGVTGTPNLVDMKNQIAFINSKKVDVGAAVTGTPQVGELATGIAGVNPKVVTVTANVPQGPNLGAQGNQVLTGAIAGVNSKTVTTTGNVPEGATLGKAGNQLLKAAIDAVIPKSVTTTGNVPGGPTLGTQGNQALTGAINNVNSKTVAVNANVSGTGEVNSLASAINALHDKVVNVVTHVQQVFGFRKGGSVPPNSTILVGEDGPELLQIGSRGGFVTNAPRTRALLNSGPNSAPSVRPGTASPDNTETGGGGPITVNVMLSQEQIAGIAQAEIIRQNRATKRTVLAGTGVTF